MKAFGDPSHAGVYIMDGVGDAGVGSGSGSGGAAAVAFLGDAD